MPYTPVSKEYRPKWNRRQASTNSLDTTYLHKSCSRLQYAYKDETVVAENRTSGTWGFSLEELW